MIGLGLWEIIVIILAVIVLVNPKEMPEIARKLGKWYKKVRNIREKLDKEAKELENEFRSTDNGEENTYDRND
jgi:Sec-independent protein translocase protein TatA